MRYRAHAATDTGRRKNNEDTFLSDASLGVFAVADGMGGYEGGEVASRTALDAIVRYFGRMVDDGIGLGDDTDDHALARSRVDLSLRIAHREICRRKVGRLSQMGSTIALLAVEGDRALVAHVGDSRVYRFREGALEALTRDHSLYAELESSGRGLPPRQKCGFTHVITRALGAPGDSRADIAVHGVRAGDVFLLASDGLTDVLADAHVEAILRSAPAEHLPEILCGEAYEAGSSDNITVVLVEAS